VQGNTIRKLIIIFPVVFILAACGPPIGHISSPDSIVIGDHDDFWTVPRRQTYNLGDDFVRTDDLWVFISSNGAVQRINTERVAIRLITNPNASTPDAAITMSGDVNGNGNGNGNGYRGYTLGTHIGKGRKIIIVSYDGMNAEYSIEILDPLGLDSDDGNEDGGGVWIKW